MVLDYIFVALLGFGLAGAAIATVCGECIGGLLPLFYFARKNSSPLKLGKTHFYGKVLLRTCTNGSSELMTNLSSSIVNSLYNLQLIKFAGENGVAAYGTIMYVNFIFVAIFIGYSIGSAPIISYHYGAKNHDELKNLSKKSLTLICIWAVSIFTLAQLLAAPASKLFVGYDQYIWFVILYSFKQRAYIGSYFIFKNTCISAFCRFVAACNFRHKRYMAVYFRCRALYALRYSNFLYQKSKILSLYITMSGVKDILTLAAYNMMKQKNKFFKQKQVGYHTY